MASRDAISNINFERIQWCCEQSNISIEDLANAVKISFKNLTKVKLSFTQLSKIADYFGYGVLFFLNPEPAKFSSRRSAEELECWNY